MTALWTSLYRGVYQKLVFNYVNQNGYHNMITINIQP